MSKGVWAAVAGVAALTFAAAPAFAECAVEGATELPVTMVGLLPTIPAKINGQEAAVVPTPNSFYNFVSTQAAGDLKLKTQRGGAEFIVTLQGKRSSLRYAAVDSLLLGRASFGRMMFVVGSLGDGKWAGIVGQGVLGSMDTEYDIGHGALRLVRTNKDCANTSLAYWAAGKGYSVIDVTLANQDIQRIVGEASVNGVKVRVAFDSSVNVSKISLSTAKRAGIKMDDPEVKRIGVEDTPFGPAASWSAPVASFKIGSEDIRNTRLRVVDTLLSSYADMVLGADFFLAHRIYFANAQKRVFFTYNGGPVFDLTSASTALQEPRDEPAPSGAAGR